MQQHFFKVGVLWCRWWQPWFRCLASGSELALHYFEAVRCRAMPPKRVSKREAAASAHATAGAGEPVLKRPSRACGAAVEPLVRKRVAAKSSPEHSADEVARDAEHMAFDAEVIQARAGEPAVTQPTRATKRGRSRAEEPAAVEQMPRESHAGNKRRKLPDQAAVVTQAHMETLYQDAARGCKGKGDRAAEAQLLSEIKDFGRFPMQKAAEEKEKKLANKLKHLKNNQHFLLVSQKYLDVLRQHTKQTAKDEGSLELMQKVRAFYDRTQRLPNEIREAVEPEEIEERNLAWLMNKAVRSKTLQDIHLEEIRSYRQQTKETAKDEESLVLMQKVRAFYERTQRLPNEMGEAVEPEEIEERNLAWLMNKAVRSKTLQDIHLEEIRSYRDSFHEEFEDMWKALVIHYWYIGDEYKTIANPEAKHILMRRFDAARNAQSQTALDKLSRHLQVQLKWWDSMETPPLRMRHSVESVLRRCRKRLYQQAANHVKSAPPEGVLQDHGTGEPSDGAVEPQAAAAAEPARGLANATTLGSQADDADLQLPAACVQAEPFLTPRTLRDLAASMLEESHRQSTPFGCDFADLAYHGKMHLDDLVDGFAVLEGVATDATCLALDNAKILRSIFECNATVAAVGSGPGNLDENSLIARLAEVCEKSVREGGNWIASAVCRKAVRVKAIDPGELVKAFLAFLDEFGLVPTLTHFSLNRILTLCIWHAYLSAPDKKRRSELTHRSAFIYVRPARLQCENSVNFLGFGYPGGCSGNDRAFAAKAMILMDGCRVNICTVGYLAMAVLWFLFMM